MPRGKDAPTQVGGQIDPYVQRSIQQGKQQAESRLLAAMQEKGATERTAMTEAGATQRAGIQARTQREGIAAQQESDDKRAAEDERARREDREFAKTMSKVTQEMQIKEAELDRDMQRAMFEGRREDAKEVAGRQLAWDKVRAILGERANIRQSNLILSMTKGLRKKEEREERTKTTLLGQADEFDNDKGKYEQARESILDSIANDKRMDLTARKPRVAFRGAGAGMTFPAPAERQENLADPMGVLQDQITKREGKISVEDLSSANIHKIVEQMVEGKIQTEDINETFGALHAMQEVIDDRRLGVDRKSGEFDFWNDTYNDISQFIRNLTKLEDSDKKIKGSETQTVGKEMIYALRTIRKGTLGNRVSRFRAAKGDVDADKLIDEFSGPKEPYELFDLTDESLDKYDIEAQSFINDMIMPMYQQTENGGLE